MIVIIISNVCFKHAPFLALGANIPFWKRLTLQSSTENVSLLYIILYVFTL